LEEETQKEEFNFPSFLNHLIQSIFFPISSNSSSNNNNNNNDDVSLNEEKSSSPTTLDEILTSFPLPNHCLINGFLIQKFCFKENASSFSYFLK